MPMKVRGYFSIFGNRDRSNEVVDPGSFSRWIKANPTTPVDIYWQHNHVGAIGVDLNSVPIGVTTMVRQENKGTYFEGVINDTAKGLDIQAFLRTHGRAGASYSFDAITDYYDDNGVRHIADQTLNEVTIAARLITINTEAYVEPIPQEGEIQ